MTIIGRRESPRVLLKGWSPDDLSVLTPMFPTVRAITDVSEVDQGDWDALITSSGVGYTLAGHLFVVSFGGPCGRPHDASDFLYGNTEVNFTKPILSVELQIPDDLLEGLRPLVDELVEQLGEPPYLGLVESQRAKPMSGLPVKAILPFLSSRTGIALAGRFKRLGGQAECWMIPHQTRDIRWIHAAFKHWGSVQPLRFPSDPDWKHAPQWRTPEEVATGHELEAVDTERAQLLAALHERRTEIVERIGRLQRQGDIAERALLSEQGEPLVAAVGAALKRFGFRVDDMDEHYQGGPKREDLQASEPGSDWIALVEIKGYKDGAKTNDLGKFVRYTELFMKDNLRPPSARWYIVNQFMKSDPAMRPPPLQGAKQDIEVFAEADGLICDTRDLLRLWLDVQSGRVSPEEARVAMRDAHGLFPWPPTVPPPLEPDPDLPT